jgi:Reverse transcriptase (RNA-dependent DNA polymerase)
VEDSEDNDVDGGEAPAAAEPRYPVRDRRPPDVYEPVFLASKTVTFKEEPNTHHDALSGPDAPLWRKAMDEELASLLEMNAWKLVPLPPGVKPLPCRWTYKLKRDGDSNIDRYKARLVAKGYAQKEGIDFNEVFAPVSKHATLRALLSVVAAEDLELMQLDVKLAFLNGELEEDIYMQQPPTYEQGSGLVCHLQRSLYGLRQAPRAWNLRFRKELAALGFRQTQSDPSLFVKGSGVDAIYLLVYVDDVLIAARGDLASGVYDAIKELFTVRNLGNATYFLGMHITRNRTARTITLSQEQLTLNMLERFSMADAKPRRTPIPTGTRLTAEGDTLDKELFPYSALVGALLYLASCTRPDIAFAANSLARYMAAPTEQHWLIAKGVLRYLRGTVKLGITFGPSADLQAYCDADFGGDLDSRRSTTAYIFVLNKGAISWGSRLQPTVAASTTEAEYMAAAVSAREALWMKKLMTDLGVSAPGPIRLSCDNQAALSLLKDPIGHSRTKHIDIMHHFARERVMRKELAFVYCSSEENVADVLTKPLTEARFARCLQSMGMGQ